MSKQRDERRRHQPEPEKTPEKKSETAQEKDVGVVGNSIPMMPLYPVH